MEIGFILSLETYELGINQFTDLTRDEFRKLISGIPLPPLSKNSSKTTIKLHEHIRQKRTIVRNESVPINWVAGNLDLRTTAIPIKNQKSCGSCWAFSATALSEYSLWKKLGQYYDLSEQQCVDCAEPNGCDGGWMSDCLANRQTCGLNNETIYPYKAIVTKCNCNSTNGFNTSYAQAFYSIEPNETTMAYVMYRQQAWVSACLNATDLQHYSSGIVSPTSCNNSPSHAINLVGYGTLNGTAYWIARNSWGTNWREKGYFRILRGIGACGLSADYEDYRAYLA